MRLKTRIERTERATEATARPYSDWTVEQLDARIEHLLSQLTPSEREQIEREVELELEEKYSG